MASSYDIRLSSSGIRHLKRADIDTARWDDCIAKAANTIIYGYHFYLDHMAAGQWDALVLGDYEAVMPLTWRRKYGISYLFQPPFTQQTGIFSPTVPGKDLIDGFLQKARQHFRFAEIFFNYGNSHPAFRPHTNFILSLDAPYSGIAAKYKTGLQKALKLAAHLPLNYSSGPGLIASLAANRREYAARVPHVGPADYKNFERLCFDLQSRDRLVLRAVINHKSEPLATALLLRDERRLYLVQSTTPPAGRRTAANHFLLDQLIKEFAGSSLTIDFEGSDIPGIAHFYASFGAIDQPYYFCKYNDLPWPLSKR